MLGAAADGGESADAGEEQGPGGRLGNRSGARVYGQAGDETALRVVRMRRDSVLTGRMIAAIVDGHRHQGEVLKRYRDVDDLLVQPLVLPVGDATHSARRRTVAWNSVVGPDVDGAVDHAERSGPGAGDAVGPRIVVVVANRLIRRQAHRVGAAIAECEGQADKGPRGLAPLATHEAVDGGDSEGVDGDVDLFQARTPHTAGSHVGGPGWIDRERYPVIGMGPGREQVAIQHSGKSSKGGIGNRTKADRQETRMNRRRRYTAENTHPECFLHDPFLQFQSFSIPQVCLTLSQGRTIHPDVLARVRTPA